MLGKWPEIYSVVLVKSVALSLRDVRVANQLNATGLFAIHLSIYSLT